MGSACVGDSAKQQKHRASMPAELQPSLYDVGLTARQVVSLSISHTSAQDKQRERPKRLVDEELKFEMPVKREPEASQSDKIGEILSKISQSDPLANRTQTHLFRSGPEPLDFNKIKIKNSHWGSFRKEKRVAQENSDASSTSPNEWTIMSEDHNMHQYHLLPTSYSAVLPTTYNSVGDFFAK